MKTCNKCGETKEFYAFGFCKANKDGHQAYCKMCSNDNNKKWYIKNKQKHNLNSNKNYQNNKATYNTRSKKWHNENKEKHELLNTLYRQNNRALFRTYYSKRNAYKKNAVPSFLKSCKLEKLRILNTYKLSMSLSKATGIEHHVDHMWPLSDGGPHWSGNLQVITATENQIKHAKVDPAIKATIQEMLIEEEQMRYAQH
jgi:hypothetical protein